MNSVLQALAFKCLCLISASCCTFNIQCKVHGILTILDPMFLKNIFWYAVLWQMVTCCCMVWCVYDVWCSSSTNWWLFSKPGSHCWWSVFTLCSPGLVSMVCLVWVWVMGSVERQARGLLSSSSNTFSWTWYHAYHYNTQIPEHYSSQDPTL